MRNRLLKITEFFNLSDPSLFFTVCSVLFFCIYNIVTPPLQAPDELSHLYRIYQLSEGTFVSEKNDQRVGGAIPYSVTDFALPMRMASTSMHKVNTNDLQRLIDQPPAAHKREFRDFPNTAQYNIVSYLPQVSAFVILRMCEAPVIVLYYGARVAIFCFWLIAVLISIRLIPFGKWLLVLLALLPMNLYLSNSLSADSVTNALAFLLLAVVFQLAFTTNIMTLRKKVLLSVICILLALAKIVYMPLILLIFLIPHTRYRSKRKFFLFSAGLVSVALFCAVLWSNTVIRNYIPDHQYNPLHRNDATVGFQADLHKQKEHILDNPSYFPGVILNTIFNSPQPYLKSYIGVFGAFQAHAMPGRIYVFAWILILTVTFFSKTEFRISLWQRGVLLISVFCSLVILLLSQHLTWDQVGSGIVELMQGRYLIPLMPVFLFSVSHIGRGLFNPAIVVSFSIVTLNIVAATTLYQRYIRVPYATSEYFYTSLEKLDEHGNFVTSNPRYKLSADNNRTHLQVRTGRSAVLSSAQFPYLLSCRLPAISGGDLIEVELWKKGTGASLVLNGATGKCGDIYMANDYPDYIDNKGWEHVHMHFEVPGNCKNFDLTFLVHNPGNNLVYIDDLSFIVRRGKIN